MNNMNEVLTVLDKKCQYLVVCLLWRLFIWRFSAALYRPELCSHTHFDKVFLWCDN